ncbi:glycosyltransferase family 17 protein [Fomitiporia mediterranea MF3/22]|uniref:glycosyltransferase family 17 protein n=1 Tax=Fomitiporia mediterranea (strain MF3/22) TaxID=694068 RepID=UPI000440793B|nr:glycosyltransferase family 17 protein [Fomitiporia mediterranea MF3/22]EJD01701.1 glycosyltransferase family 17 protein [Fomitiporia mediterranea MF3/22]
MPRRKFLLILSLLLIISFGLLLAEFNYQIRNALSYATRPLWDRPDGPHDVLPHFYADGMSMDDHACQLHGWNHRPEGEDVRVLDAVLMSSEVDLLEIRLHELDRIVDRFFIVESNATFTGLPKEMYFANNRERFAAFEHKIEYHFLPGYELRDGRTAWDVEAHTRNIMSRQLRAYISSLPSSTQTLVVMSDIDEIPSWHTLALLKACDFGNRIHLLLRNYLYSFEWYIGMSSWRASVHRFDDSTYYRHSMSTNVALADAGWHCSFCFRTIPEYILKMRGFSHSDRIGGNERLLDERRIQEVICKGEDIFGMLPEAYSYADLLSQMYLQPSRSAVHIPDYVIRNADRFRYLLPGGCMRET